MPVRQPTTADKCAICQEDLIAGQNIIACDYGDTGYVCYTCVEAYPNGQTPYNTRCPVCRREDWAGNAIVQ